MTTTRRIPTYDEAWQKVGDGLVWIPELQDWFSVVDAENWLAANA